MTLHAPVALHVIAAAVYALVGAGLAVALSGL
jgi:hypothetical protein